jgi:hypothetical protein
MKIVIAGLLILISSCVEEGENIVYYLINDTDNDLCIIKTDYSENSDTIILSQGNKITYNEYEDSGNAAWSPFHDYKKLTFINEKSDTLFYQHPLNSVKNPFNKDYYTETSRKTQKHVTYIELEYYITKEDFEK